MDLSDSPVTRLQFRKIRLRLQFSAQRLSRFFFCFIVCVGRERRWNDWIHIIECLRETHSLPCGSCPFTAKMRTALTRKRLHDKDDISCGPSATHEIDNRFPFLWCRFLLARIEPRKRKDKIAYSKLYKRKKKENRAHRKIEKEAAFENNLFPRKSIGDVVFATFRLTNHMFTEYSSVPKQWPWPRGQLYPTTIP